MDKFNLTKLDDRQVPIPPELTGPVSLWEHKALNGEAALPVDTRGADEVSSIPAHRPNHRVTSPAK